jgi:DNA-binding cell septation regulator SpoVG
MFSYEINLRKINKPGLKIKAVASILIDGFMSVDGFKVIEGSKGLFVSVPNHKGSVMEDGVKVDKYFDDVRFIGEEGISFGQELKEAILSEYRNGSSSSSYTPPSRGQAASAHTKPKATQPSKSEEAQEDNQPKQQTPSKTPSAPNRARKPIWDFT